MDLEERYNTIVDIVESSIGVPADDVENQITDTFGVNRRFLEDSFGFITGMSLKRYMRRRKLAAAGMKYKENKNLSLEDIAEEFGYGDSSAFSKSFSNEYKMNPSELRTNDWTDEGPLYFSDLIGSDERGIIGRYIEKAPDNEKRKTGAPYPKLYGNKRDIMKQNIRLMYDLNDFELEFFINLLEDSANLTFNDCYELMRELNEFPWKYIHGNTIYSDDPYLKEQFADKEADRNNFEVNIDFFGKELTDKICAAIKYHKDFPDIGLEETLDMIVKHPEMTASEIASLSETAYLIIYYSLFDINKPKLSYEEIVNFAEIMDKKCAAPEFFSFVYQDYKNGITFEDAAEDWGRRTDGEIYSEMQAEENFKRMEQEEIDRLNAGLYEYYPDPFEDKDARASLEEYEAFVDGDRYFDGSDYYYEPDFDAQESEFYDLIDGEQLYEESLRQNFEFIMGDQEDEEITYSPAPIATDFSNDPELYVISRNDNPLPSDSKSEKPSLFVTIDEDDIPF